MDGLEDVRPYVRSLDACIGNLSETLEPLLCQGLEDIIANCLLPQEKVKIYHSHLYTVISILFAYIKVLGIKTETHPIMKELTRIKESMRAMKDIEAASAKKNETSKESADAANQFFQRTLGTTGENAALHSLESPAISSANFKGTHTKFTDEDSTQEPTQKKKHPPPNKVTKPSRRK